jgi:hypothetical protein
MPNHGNERIAIKSLWIGTKVLSDGTFSDVLENGYVALQEADWMSVADEEGWPRRAEPGDIFWASFPVNGVTITLHKRCLLADDGDRKVRVVPNDRRYRT